MSLSKMLQEYRDGLRGLPTYDELAAIANAEQCADPIVERNVSMLRQRSTIGVEKYGVTLADNKLPLHTWLNHALEESLDQANYLQAAMAKIDSAASKVTDSAKDVEFFGISYLVDGVNVHPSRVTVLRPSSASASVQAQEPVDSDEIIVPMMPTHLLDFTSNRLYNAAYCMGFKARSELPASVQPVAVPDGWRAAIDGLMDFAPTNEGPLPGMTRGGNWLRKHDVIEALSNIAAPAAQGDAKPEALLYAALNTQGRIVYSHESYENVDMNRRYIKTPTTIVGLSAIAAKAAS